MSRRRLTMLAIIPLGLAGCALSDSEPGPPPEDAAVKARERVQQYLDAMVAKDPDLGRSQFCPVLHESFDQAATGPNGDFAEHFTVTQAEITHVQDSDGGQEVTAAVTVSAADQPAVINLRFTVVEIDGQWCIADEVPVDEPSGDDPDQGAEKEQTTSTPRL